MRREKEYWQLIMSLLFVDRFRDVIAILCGINCLSFIGCFAAYYQPTQYIVGYREKATIFFFASKEVMIALYVRIMNYKQIRILTKKKGEKNERIYEKRNLDSTSSQ